MNNKNIKHELSYYALLLLSYIIESFPELYSDNEFIRVRATLAAETYEQAIKNGFNIDQSEKFAEETLYRGLHFSKFDTIKNILWNEFADLIPQNKVRSLAIKLLSYYQSIFAKYDYSKEDFANSVEFDLLYTELTGAIAIWFEENELQ